MRIDYAIVYVSDMKRSVSFYRDMLGLPLKFESPGWSEFATDGATLALHASAVPADAASNPIRLRMTTRYKISLARARESNATRPTSCQQPPGSWSR